MKIYYCSLAVLILLMQVKNGLAEVIDESKLIAEEATICEQVNREDDGWIDDAHAFLSVQFCEPSVWFDSFFSDERMDEEVRAGTRVRWQNDFVLTVGGKWQYISNVRASFKLPKAKKNINLIFETDDENDLQDIIPANQEETKGSLGLLYEVTES